MYRLFIFFIIFCPLISLGQTKNVKKTENSNRTKLYMDLTYNKHFNSELPRIYNYPHMVGQWRTIDVGKFDNESKERPLKYVIPFSIKSGVSVQTDNGNTFNLGLSYNHYSSKDTLGSRLRYSDQLDFTQGYVMPSEYLLLSGFHLYRSVGLNADYLIEDAINGYHHRVGLGIGVHRIIGSSYHLNLYNTETRNHESFSGKDLTFTDGFWHVQPRFIYQGNITHNEKADLWFVSSFSFNVGGKNPMQPSGPLGHLWSTGFRVEI